MISRGISETISVILLFAVIVSSVTVAYTVGVPVLEQQSNKAQVEGAANGFQLLQSNINRHASMGVEEQNLQLGLSGGSLKHGNTTSVNVSVGGESVVFESKPIIYSFSGTTVVYDSGMVARSEGKRSVAVSDGSITNQNGLLFIRAPTVSGNDTMSPEDQVTIRTRLSGRTTFEFNAEGEQVTVTIRSEYAGAWYSWLDSEEGISCSQISDETTSCIVSSVSTVQIQQVEIDSRFDI